MLGSIFQDLQFAVRTFRRSPGFTFAVLFTLALGIGANTAIFSVVDGALLHPVPFPDADRLASLYQTFEKSGDRNAVSYPNLLDWQQQSQTFEAIAGVRGDTFTLTGRGDPEQVAGLGVSSNLLSVLRTQPLLGRMFTKEEDQRSGRPVVLLGERYWKLRFAGDPQIVGQALRLNGRDVEVIGIMPASVRLRRYFEDIFTPLGQNDNPAFYLRGSGDDTEGLGRIKPGVPLSQARAEMETHHAKPGGPVSQRELQGWRQRPFLCPRHLGRPKAGSYGFECGGWFCITDRLHKRGESGAGPLSDPFA